MSEYQYDMTTVSPTPSPIPSPIAPPPIHLGVKPVESLIFTLPYNRPQQVILTNEGQTTFAFAIGFEPSESQWFRAQPACGVLPSGSKATVEVSAVEFIPDSNFGEEKMIIRCVEVPPGTEGVDRTAFTDATAVVQKAMSIAFHF